jgi:predicted nucleotidyltransferase
MSTFSELQLQDLRELQRAARELNAEPVVIGAMAYRLFIDDTNRTTLDIDLAVALDLDEFQRLEKTLMALGWRSEKMQEQRWNTPRGNRIDLLPAGPSLRKQGKIIWRRSGFVMSLAGFDHVFRDSAEQDVGEGLIFKVIPPPVLALLKIAAYLDDSQRRSKDLLDFRSLMKEYERDSQRIFSDEVFHANLPDVEFAGAFLLGLDLKAIATKQDKSLIDSFVGKVGMVESSGADPTDEDWSTRDASHFQQQLSAFLKGFQGAM